MTETLLNGVINMFAIFTFRQGKTFYPRSKELVEFYLKSYLGLSTTCETYLGLFSSLLEFYDSIPHEKGVLGKNLGDIATALKTELPRQEQYICLLLFMDLAAQVQASENAVKDDVAILASGFSIINEAVSDIETLCLHSEDYEKLSERFIVLTNEPSRQRWRCKTLLKPDFEGSFTIWFAGEIDVFFIKTSGESRLILEGAPLLPGRVYRIRPQATLNDHWWHSIDYSEIAALFRTTTGGVSFAAENLNFRYPGSDNGLHSFSFTTSGGEMVAIMGGSGSGKSTLLGVLNGSQAPDSGRVLINGKDLHQNLRASEGAIGYVSQDDLLFEDLTVFENLYYSARLCLADRSEEELRNRAEEVLKDLGQLESSNLKVGSPLNKTISGGQRKRLNIALELIREPAILFVDEPTSGLSSSDSENVMSLLKVQAFKGNLVFVVIHQPSSRIFKLFDRLWVLDKGGRPIFDGKPLDGLVYFQSEIHQAGMEEYACPNAEMSTLNRSLRS